MNVKIEKLVYGGEGLGHSEGRTVFVPYVLPGEVVAVRATERKKKFVRGQLQHIVTAAPERAMAACAHFAACGGCHYQHIPYEEQLRYKADILRETLWRIGRVKWEGEIRAHPSPPFGYRNRAQWKVRQLGERQAVGYFRGGSTALLPVEQCPILSPRLEQALGALRRLAADGRLPATLREVEVFADERDEKLLLNASCTEFSGAPDELAETLRGALPGAESVLLHESSRDRFELFGPGYITYRAGGTPLRVGHLSFFQVNRHLVEEMARVATEDARGTLALDLYCGVGLFSVPLAARCQRVIAVESNEAAARDLQENLAACGGRAQAVCADVERFLAGVTETPDLVVLDPPRAGIAPAALQQLLRIGPKRILYWSCDPSTLARDLGALTAGGSHGVGTYEIDEMRLFDVFPQTYHIETLVRLARR
jgi:23S rRNA (uracil1939-C5)-methyltransferase